MLAEVPRHRHTYTHAQPPVCCYRARASPVARLTTHLSLITPCPHHQVRTELSSLEQLAAALPHLPATARAALIEAAAKMDQAGGGGGGSGEFESPNGDLTMGGSIVRIDVSKVRGRHRRTA
jgi:hypothetical protein